MLRSVKRQTQRPQIHEEHMEAAARQRDESEDQKAADLSAVVAVAAEDLPRCVIQPVSPDSNP